MQDAFAHCEALVRASDKDRFLSALFAPAEQRCALHALYAFNIEAARVRDLAREPLAGEVRLQWWREALAGARPAEARGHPVASALLEVIARYRLPLALFDELLVARGLDFGDELLASLEQLELYLKHTSSNMVDLAGRILGAAALSIAGPAGLSIGLVGLLRAFALDASKGRLFIPADLLVRHAIVPQDIPAGQPSAGLAAALADLRDVAARRYEEARALTAAEQAYLAAWLPAALVPLHLRALKRGEAEPFRPVEVSQWRRQWALWRTARTGRLPAL